jgi:hypothetical protein
MKQLTNIIIPISISLLLASCGNQTTESATTKEASVKGQNSAFEGPQIGSYDLFEKTVTDNFYIKEQINKPLIISNLIVESYLLDKDNNATLTCLVYSPEKNEIVGGNAIGRDYISGYVKPFLINGHELTVTTKVGTMNIDPGLGATEIQVKLKDSKLLKSLSFYNGSSPMEIVQKGEGDAKNFVDLITVSGILTEYGSRGDDYGGPASTSRFYIEDVTITKQRLPTQKTEKIQRLPEEATAP